MEKKEKKSDLEQLLNSLIEKGWKPRWENVNKVIKTWIDEFGDGYVLFDGELNWYKQRWCNMTELVSKWSWLWQFVCENGMIPKENHERVYDVSWWEYWVDCKAQIISREPEYRLIETALTDEDKLEQFLLDNIYIDE
jgi:hypothetical protein